MMHPLDWNKAASDHFFAYTGQNGHDLLHIFNQAAETNISTGLIAAMFAEYNKANELAAVCVNMKKKSRSRKKLILNVPNVVFPVLMMVYVVLS